MYTYPELVLQNRDVNSKIIEYDENKWFLWLTKRSILTSLLGVYLMYFTAHTADPLKSDPSLARQVLVYFHVVCVLLIIIGTSTLCIQIVREINERAYLCVTTAYVLMVMVLGTSWLYLYHQGGYDAAMRFMNVGEWEIFYFTYVYYLLSIVTYVNGNIHNTLLENKQTCLFILASNLILGPTSYSLINCLL